MPRPKKVAPKVQEITSDHEFDSNVLRFQRSLREILGPGIHIHLAAVKLRPSRLAELAVGRPKFAPLRWSNLTDAQKKALEDLVPYRGAEDLVMYGDTCVVTCPEAEWETEQRRKAQLIQQRAGQDLTVQQLERELGMPVDTKWEELDRGYAPRPPRA